MLLTIAQQFSPAIIDIAPLGNGLINDTFLVTAADFFFVLQRINAQVFLEPEQIMSNLQQLNQHLGQKTAPKLQMPALLKTTMATKMHCFRLN